MNEESLTSGEASGSPLDLDAMAAAAGFDVEQLEDFLRRCDDNLRDKTRGEALRILEIRLNSTSAAQTVYEELRKHWAARSEEVRDAE